MVKKTAYLGFCNVDILIFTKPYARNSVLRVIYVKSIVDILFYLITSLPIYYIQVSFSKDFLFKPLNSIDLSLYAYLINADLKEVLARNDIFN